MKKVMTVLAVFAFLMGGSAVTVVRAEDAAAIANKLEKETKLAQKNAEKEAKKAKKAAEKAAKEAEKKAAKARKEAEKAAEKLKKSLQS